MKQVIKYAALLFALILSASIIGGCLTAGVVLARTLVEKTGEFDRENGGNGVWYRDEDGDLVFRWGNYRVASSSGEVKSGTEEFAGIEINAMDINVGSCELVVETWEKDFVSVEYENIPVEYRIYEENGILKINKKDNININFIWNSFTEKQKILVSVPAAQAFESVVVDKGSGSAKLNGLQVNELSMDNGSGGVGISNVTAEKISVDSGSGGVNISDTTTKKSVFNTGSGSFVVQNCELGESSMDAGSGFVNFENVNARNLVLDTGSGRVDFSGTLTGNCMFEAGSGSLNVVIYGNEKDYNIRTDMGSGGFYLNGERQDDEDNRIEHSGAGNLLVFEAGSGRVSVDFRMTSNDTDNAENFDR